MATEPDRAALRLVDRSDAVRTASALLAAGLDMAYQPIVHLGSGAVIAYEALARPRHPDTANPAEFFAALEDGGQRLEGERAAFTAALAAFKEGLPPAKLFINASPTTLVDPDFDVGELLELLDAHGLRPSDLVVEVTESEAVHDLATLASRADRLRRMGIGLAIDDAGAGHASFRVITRLRPSFIKLDRDLVSNVDGDGARHAFIEAMVRFSRQIGSRLIAEGIETQAELASLTGLGVEAGQGYLIARPQVGAFVPPSRESRRMIATTAQRPQFGTAQVTTGDLVQPGTVIEPEVTVAEAYARFLADPSLGSVLVLQNSRVVAQLTRRSAERFLASPGSWDRLADRPALDFADHQPLSVASTLDVVDVGAILAARPAHQVGDDLAVHDPTGRFVGVLAVRDVIRTLTDVRRRGRQDLNPLSGLYGPGWLESEVARRLEGGDTLSTLLIDVDGFRRLNEIGGFVLGDDVIRVLSFCLTGVVSGVLGAAVAHVGGDDFLVVTPPQHYEDVVSEFVRAFETEVVPFLRLELRQRDALHLLDGINLSMASVDLRGSPPAGHRHLDWAQDGLGPLMALAKEHEGHACVRRSGDVVAVTSWHGKTRAERTISLGQAEPGAVLALVDLVDAAWEGWSGAEGPHGFPGPAAALEGLRDEFLKPWREQAVRARRDGQQTIPLTLSGQEADLLALLDRLALVSQRAYATHVLPLPPEMALLDRVIHQRARAVTRHDRLGRAPQGVFLRGTAAEGA